MTIEKNLFRRGYPVFVPSCFRHISVMPGGKNDLTVHRFPHVETGAFYAFGKGAKRAGGIPVFVAELPVGSVHLLK